MSGAAPVYAEKAALGNAQEINAAAARLLARLPAAARLGASTRVLVKPNLLSKNAPSRAVTTHPELLRGVILALRAHGVRHITVADSPGGPYSAGAMRALYEGCGLTAVCRELGAELFTGSQSGTRAAKGAMVREFELIAPVLEADFIVNLPKMKTHVLTSFSGAVKNLFGCVPGLHKAEFHMRFPEREHFADMLVDLCETVAADVHIVDGLLAMEGDGPGSGSPRRCDVLLAGEDPYLVDMALCRLMGMEPMATPVLAAAHRRGLCPAALPEECFIGADEAKRPQENFTPPRSYSGRVDFTGNVPGFLRPLVGAIGGALAPKPVIRKALCIGCGKCAAICPQKTIAIEDGKARIYPKARAGRAGCIRCFCCHEICPVHAVDVKSSGLFRM